MDHQIKRDANIIAAIREGRQAMSLDESWFGCHALQIGEDWIETFDMFDLEDTLRLSSSVD